MVQPERKFFESLLQGLKTDVNMEEFRELIGESEEDEEEEEDWLETMRIEIIEYILRRHSLLRALDIARILEWKVKDVNRVLRQLERSGRAKRTKLGKQYVWTLIEETQLTSMYY